jgi:GAF domain-containing protein
MRQGLKGKKTGAVPKPRVARKARTPAKAKAKSNRPAAKTASRKGSKGRESAKRLSEALAREAAISEILKVMSSSPGDVQPVLEAVAKRAAHLCDAPYANVLIRDGEMLRPSAFSRLPQGKSVLPIPVTRGSVNGRAVLDRTTIHHADVVPFLDEFPDARQNVERLGVRAQLAVPLLRKGEAYGTIVVFRRTPLGFSSEQIALVETFARQAVIAIENARLFDETQEALERQTATSEILRVISQSPNDVQPVFDAIVHSAARLFARKAALRTVEVDGLRRRARSYAENDEFHGPDVVPINGASFLGRVVLECRALQIADTREPTVPPFTRAYADKFAYRALASAPLVRDGAAIGVISVSSKEPGAMSDKQMALLATFADQAVIAIENVRLFNETREALQRQTATSEILGVISQSPTDVQPVFETIATAAMKLCGGNRGHVFTSDGEKLHVGALASTTPGADGEIRKHFPRRLGNDLAACRAILTGGVVVIPDVLDDTEYALRELAPAGDFRSVLAVPLLREGSPIGAIGVGRPEPGPFPDNQIALLQIFASQAVIAIENVRLFNETKEALERQTATSEILRVISQSPTDVQPVFDAIAAAALRLCQAGEANVFTFDGRMIHLAALAHADPRSVDALRGVFPRPPSRDTVVTRAVLTGSVVEIPDVMADPEYKIAEAALASGFRRVLAIPLMREGKPIGAIALGRSEPGSFPYKQVALVQTFADQAVIAIENVRLFNETKEALERQTATSEILRVISQSPRDVQPVFETIVGAALRLCSAGSANLFTFDGELLHLAAYARPDTRLDPAGDMRALRSNFPRAPGRDLAGPRAVLTCSVVSIPDVLIDDEYLLKESAVAGGFRSVLAVPLIRDGAPIGAIVIGRPEAGEFADKLLALLQTFADQAVIAIENVRLFTELEARTFQLTQSVGELKALGEVGQAVSSTLDLETVLTTIVSRAAQLAGMDGGSIWEYDETREEFYLHATDRAPDDLVDALRATPIRKGEGALGRLAMTGEPVQIRDIAEEPNYPSRLREIGMRGGLRSLLAVPLLREDNLLGALAVNRRSPGDFAPEVIALLKTFATQSALAIQNARLYRELEDKSRELEAASHHKSEFLANMSHELRTPLNAIIGFSEVLYERMFGEINEKQAEYVGDILESGRHLLSLINDILDLSKIEAGRMELELSDFDLPGTIENALVLVRERATRRGITLGCTVDERLKSIRADERKVKQVLLNLLSNALKFTPEDGKIDVRAAVNDGQAEVSVTDTGIGIAPEDQAAVFEEFRQVGMTSKKVEGTGLGLAISRKFIELHGGKIWVESQVGSGSTFIFTLPLP